MGFSASSIIYNCKIKNSNKKKETPKTNPVICANVSFCTGRNKTKTDECTLTGKKETPPLLLMDEEAIEQLKKTARTKNFLN